MCAYLCVCLLSVLTIVLLNATLLKKNFLLETSSNKSCNDLICKASQTSFSETLYESSKISLLCRFLPVHEYNLALLPDNCNA